MHFKLGFLVSISIVVVQLSPILGQPQQPHEENEHEEPEEVPVVIVPIPKVPVAPNCVRSGPPGSTNWNACLQKFQRDMQGFQNQVQIYNQRVIDAHAKAAQQQHPAANAQNSNSNSNGGVQYTTSSSSQGYTVRTTGIPVSTKTRDSVVTIKLTVGNFKAFEKRVEGKEIMLVINMGEGKKKYAAVKLPKGVDVSEIKFDRSADSIMISGPAQKGNGGFETSHSSSSSSSGGIHSSSFSGTGGSTFGRSFSFGNPAAIPAIPSPPVFNDFNPYANNHFNPYFQPQAPMWFF